MRMSKISVSCAVAALTLSVAACSTTQAASPAAAGGAQALTVYAPTDKPMFQPLVTAFEKANPGVTLKLTYGDGQSLLTQLPAGTAPDVFLALGGGTGGPLQLGSLAKQGYLADLSGSSWASEIPAVYKDLLSYQGKVYAWPGIVQPIGAFYNQGTLDKYGLKAPTTWSEVLSLCSAAKAEGIVAYAAGVQDAWTTQLTTYALVSTLVDAKDPGFEAGIATGANTFSKSAWVDALTKYDQMRTAGCFNENATGTSADSSYKMVGSGKALGVVQVGALLSSIQDASPKGTKLVMEPLPATDDPSETHMPASLANVMVVNAKAKNPTLAKKFIDFMSEPAQLATYAELQGGSAPTIPDPGFKSSSAMTSFDDFSAKGLLTPFPDPYWPNAEVQAAHLQGIQSMFLGKLTPQGVAQSMDKAVKVSK